MPGLKEKVKMIETLKRKTISLKASGKSNLQTPTMLPDTRLLPRDSLLGLTSVPRILGTPPALFGSFSFLSFDAVSVGRTADIYFRVAYALSSDPTNVKVIERNSVQGAISEPKVPSFIAYSPVKNEGGDPAFRWGNQVDKDAHDAIALFTLVPDSKSSFEDVSLIPNKNRHPVEKPFYNLLSDYVAGLCQDAIAVIDRIEIDRDIGSLVKDLVFTVSPLWHDSTVNALFDVS